MNLGGVRPDGARHRTIPAERPDGKDEAVPGSLDGIRIIEIAGVGPGPFCGMMFADHGAEVIRVERPGAGETTAIPGNGPDPLERSRRSIVVDLKSAEGVELVGRLVATADG